MSYLRYLKTGFHFGKNYMHVFTVVQTLQIHSYIFKPVYIIQIIMSI